MNEHPNPTQRPLLGLAVALSVIAMLVVPALLPLPPTGDSDIGIVLAVALVGVIAGVLVARRPDHPISWLLAATAFVGGIAGFTAEALPPGLTELNWWQAILAAISGPAYYGLLLMVLVLIPLLFPTGAPPSPRWRWLAVLAGAAAFAVAILWMIQERFCTNWNQEDLCVTTVANPIGIAGVPNPEESILGSLLFASLLLGAVLALIALVLRFRRSGAVERQQIKWVAFSTGLFIGFTLVVDLLWDVVLGRQAPAGYDLFQQVLWVLVPASIAVAILRYRLYEIDRIVSRTVSYALIAGILFAVYAGGVIGLQTVLPDSGDLAVAVSTLAAVALFAPVRRRIQGWVDRRFNRRRYDAQRVVEAFAGRLREAVDLEDVTDDLSSVVATTVEPATTSVWLR